MPAFSYIGSRGEHVVGLGTTDLSAEQYDALPYDIQQAVYINRGSDGGPLYQEVYDLPVAEPELAPAEPEQPPADPAEGDN